MLVDEHFWTKSQARAAVSFLAVLEMLKKGFIDDKLNPRRTKERLVVSGPWAVFMRVQLSQQCWITCAHSRP